MILNIFEYVINIYNKLKNREILDMCIKSGDNIRLRQPLKIVEPRELTFGSNIEDNVLVGEGTVVTKDVKPNTIVKGITAR